VFICFLSISLKINRKFSSNNATCNQINWFCKNKILDINIYNYNTIKSISISRLGKQNLSRLSQCHQ
jgi:hypothetical protein